MGREVIAMRPKWVLPVHIFAIVTMAGFLSCVACLSFRPGGWLSESEVFWVIVAVLFALGAVLLVISVWEIVRYCRVPRVLTANAIDYFSQKRFALQRFFAKRRNERFQQENRTQSRRRLLGFLEPHGNSFRQFEKNFVNKAIIISARKVAFRRGTLFAAYAAFAERGICAK